MATNECCCGHGSRDHARLDEEDTWRGCCLVFGCRCPGFVPKDQGVLL